MHDAAPLWRSRDTAGQCYCMRDGDNRTWMTRAWYCARVFDKASLRPLSSCFARMGPAEVEGFHHVRMLEKQIRDHVAGHPIAHQELKGFHHRQRRAGSGEVAKLTFVHRPDFEVIAVAVGVTQELPFPVLVCAQGILNVLAGFGKLVGLRDNQILGPVGAGEYDLFPVGRGSGFGRAHAPQDSGVAGKGKE